MPSYNCEAINLRIIKFSESDKLISLFTKQKGKVSAIAKSAFKPSSKYGGRLEALNYNHYFLAEGKNIDIISQVETIENFYKIKDKEGSLLAGLYMAKILYHFLEEKIPNEDLFNLFLNCLRMLKNGKDPSSVTRVFNILFAKYEGFLPIEKFSESIKSRISQIEDFESNFAFSRDEIENIDFILLPKIIEHVGKDISLWKNV